MNFYYVGIILAGIIIITRAFDEEFIEKLKRLFSGAPPVFIGGVLLFSFFIIMAMSWISVIREANRRFKLWK
jgi:hypothetical protein